jgi:hypothetical protein
MPALVEELEPRRIRAVGIHQVEISAQRLAGVRRPESAAGG